MYNILIYNTVQFTKILKLKPTRILLLIRYGRNWTFRRLESNSLQIMNT